MDIVNILNNYYEKYDNTPTLSTMIQEVTDLCNNSKSKVNKVEDYKEELKHISHLRSALVKDRDYISDQVLDFGKRQAMVEAISKSTDIIAGKKDGDLESVETLVKDALKVGDDINDVGLFYFNDPKAIRKRIIESDRTVSTIPTGIEAMDHLLKGGIGRGELCVVEAPPNRGKTMTLINMGAGAIRSGYNVVHFSFEMNRNKVAARYDCNFLNKDHDTILNQFDKCSDDIFNLYGSGVSREQYDQEDEHEDDEQVKWGQLVIKDYPSGTCSVDMIDSFLKHLRSATGFKPDVIIIDYPDIMKPDHHRKEKREEINDLYVSCRALGAKENYDCAVLTASQANRSSFDKKTVKANDIADDFSKVMTADEIFSFSQTARERRLGELRYYVAKARDMAAGLVIPCSINYDTKVIKSTGEAEYDESDEDQDDDDDSEFSSSAAKKTRKWAKKAHEDSKKTEELHSQIIDTLRNHKKNEDDS